MLRNLSDLLYKSVTVVNAILFAALIVIVFTQVIFRYVFASSFIWGEELSKYIFVWLMFLGISSGIYNSKHLGISYFAGKLSIQGQQMVKYFCYGLTILFFSILGGTGFMFSLMNMDSLSPVLHIAYGYIYGIIPITSLFCVLYSITIVKEVAGH
ncbi:MAG: TRAP transporter small permease [Negativicutes bacterium]